MYYRNCDWAKFTLKPVGSKGEYAIVHKETGEIPVKRYRHKPMIFPSEGIAKRTLRSLYYGRMPKYHAPWKYNVRYEDYNGSTKECHKTSEVS